MYINITDSPTSDNKGSSHDLVHYLEKENRIDKEIQPELWFNQDRTTIAAFDTRQAIDNNIAKLSKQDAKFFLLNISPSQKEITWLKERYGDEAAKEQLKAYAIKVMDEYAKNFKRPGINSSKDLLWFGKLENFRYYGHKDPEVKQGLKKRGERKPGEQMHIQIIVSRKDITNKIKLSPKNNSKGRNAEHSRRMGQFDRSAFKQSGERVFDEQFGFDRGFDETFKYANAKKKGLLDERVAMRTERINDNPQYRPALKPENKAISADNQMKLSFGKAQAEAAPYIPIKKRKKKSKEQEQDQGLTF
jgi:hypothetical protein